MGPLAGGLLPRGRERGALTVVGWVSLPGRFDVCEISAPHLMCAPCWGHTRGEGHGHVPHVPPTWPLTDGD